jgi:hypothetical protein
MLTRFPLRKPVVESTREPRGKFPDRLTDISKRGIVSLDVNDKNVLVLDHRKYAVGDKVGLSAAGLRDDGLMGCGFGEP